LTLTSTAFGVVLRSKEFHTSRSLKNTPGGVRVPVERSSESATFKQSNKNNGNGVEQPPDPGEMLPSCGETSDVKATIADNNVKV